MKERAWTIMKEREKMIAPTLYINTAPCRWLTVFNCGRQQEANLQTVSLDHELLYYILYTVNINSSSSLSVFSFSVEQTLWLMKS